MTTQAGNRVTDLDRDTCWLSVTALLTSTAERCSCYLDCNCDDIEDKKGQGAGMDTGGLPSGYLEWQSFWEAGRLTRIDALQPMGPYD